MTDFGYSLTSVWTSWSSRMTYLPGLIVFLHKMASRWHGPLRRSLSQELSAVLTDVPSFSSSFNCISVAISRLFCRYLWSVSAFVLCSPFPGLFHSYVVKYPFHHIQNVFLPFFPAFYHPNHLINPVQSLPDQPSSNHPISPIFGFLVSLFLFLFWSFPAFLILANLS